MVEKIKTEKLTEDIILNFKESVKEEFLNEVKQKMDKLIADTSEM